MINRTTRGAVLLAAISMTCAVSTAHVMAQEVRSLAPLADILISSDTDGFQALRTRAGALAPYVNPWRYTGIAAQTTRYTQGDFRQHVHGVAGVYRDVRRDTLGGVDVEAGVVRVSGRLRPIGDATWRLLPVPGTAVDVIASADLVETPKALDRGIGYTFVAAGLEQQIGERFTITGLAGWQAFSDHNARTHLRARLIWLAIPDDGITLQLRFRQYSTRLEDVGGAYFNPADYRQLLGVVAMRKRYAGWIVSGALGGGPERATEGSTHVSYLAEARAEGAIAGTARLVLRAGYNRSAGFVDSPNYAYRLLSATLIVPF